MPLLLRALQDGNETLACKILRLGTEAEHYNARDEVGCTPVVLAAQYGFLHALAMLIRAGADINLPQVRHHEKELEMAAGAIGGRNLAMALAMRRLRASLSRRLMPIWHQSLRREAPAEPSW